MAKYNNFEATTKDGALIIKTDKSNFTLFKQIFLTQGWKVEAGEGNTLYLYNEKEERAELSWEE